MKYQLFLLLLPLIAGLALVACSGGNGGTGDRLDVVATTTQIGDMAANIGGDRISLHVMLKPNQDAHDFEPQPSQIRALAQASVVLKHGLGLDGYVDKAVRGSKAEVASVTDGIHTLKGAGEEAGRPDPHVWFSVANAKQMAANVRDALVRADPASASYYTSNAARYLRQLDDLETQVRDMVNAVPPACRKLVTNHDFLGYFATAYGFHIPARTSLISQASTLKDGQAAEAAKLATEVGHAQSPILWTPKCATAFGDAMNRIVKEGADPMAEIAKVKAVAEPELKRVLG